MNIEGQDHDMKTDDRQIGAKDKVDIVSPVETIYGALNGRFDAVLKNERINLTINETSYSIEQIWNGDVRVDTGYGDDTVFSAARGQSEFYRTAAANIGILAAFLEENGIATVGDLDCGSAENWNGAWHAPITLTPEQMGSVPEGRGIVRTFPIRSSKGTEDKGQRETTPEGLAVAA